MCVYNYTNKIKMSTTTIKGKNLKSELITLPSKVQQMDLPDGKPGPKYLWVNYKNQPFEVQTPKMKVAFNMKPNTIGDTTKYSVELSFGGMEDDSAIKKFHDNIHSMDELMIDEGVKNSMAWFKKKTLSRDVAEANYSRMIKTPTDKVTGEVLTQYPKRLRVKIPYYNGEFKCDVFDKSGKKLEQSLEEILVRGTVVKAILGSPRVWFPSSSYMCQWQVKRMEVEVQEVQKGFAFLPDTDDEDDEGEEVVKQEEVKPEEVKPAEEVKPVEEVTPAEEAKPAEEEVKPEDDSEDDDSEEEAPPTPPPVKKTKGKKTKEKKTTKSKN